MLEGEAEAEVIEHLLALALALALALTPTFTLTPNPSPSPNPNPHQVIEHLLEALSPRVLIALLNLHWQKQLAARRLRKGRSTFSMLRSRHTFPSYHP